MNSEFSTIKESLDIIREAMKELSSSSKEIASLKEKSKNLEDKINLIFLIIKTLIGLLIALFCFLLKSFMATVLLIK